MMENSDLPANPTPYMDQTNGSGELYCDYTGLTKREHFAGMAMQGLLSNRAIVDIHNSNSTGWIARHALSQADALLKELEK